MALFGSGIQNGSPFYAGYEVSLPEAPTQPTAFSSLANLLLKGKVGTEATDGTTSSTDKTKIGSTYVAGTDETRNKIVSNLETIDAGISSIKAKMRQQFDRKTNPTTEKAIASITALGLDKQLGELIAARNNVKSVISQANQDLTDLIATEKAYEGDNQSAKTETALQKIGGVYVGAGTDDKGNFLTYGDLISKLKKADNTITDANGLVTGVKYTDYSPLTMGVSQRGALSTKIKDVLGATENNTRGYGKATLQDIGTIKTYTGSTNDTALLNASNNIRSILTDPEKADLAAQTMDFVKKNKNQSLLDENEVNAVKKSYTDPTNLTADELENVIQAQNKVLAKTVSGQLDSYRVSDYKESLAEGLYGQGEYDKKGVVDIATVDKVLNLPVVENDDVRFPMRTSFKNVKTANISQDPLKYTFAQGTKGFNPKTGEWLDLTLSNNETLINGVDEGVNPTNNKKEKWAWGYAVDPTKNKYVDSDGQPLYDISGKKLNTDYFIDPESIQQEFYVRLTDDLKKALQNRKGGLRINFNDFDNETTPVTKTTNKSYTTKDGKSYSYDDLIKMGYTDDQIKQAVNLGNLK